MIRVFFTSSSCVFFTYTAFIHIILLLTYASAENKTTTVLTTLPPNVLLFQRFKENYNRQYPDTKTEEKGYANFLNNLATVNELNKVHKTNVIAYQLNRYADLNPEEIEERFAIRLKPYDNMEHANKEAIMRERRHKFLEDMNLYDLYKVDDIYKTWTKKYKKTIPLKKKTDDMIHYYRFIKSVAEANRQKFAGNDVSLGEDADKVREPNQFFYGK